MLVVTDTLVYFLIRTQQMVFLHLDKITKYSLRYREGKEYECLAFQKLWITRLVISHCYMNWYSQCSDASFSVLSGIRYGNLGGNFMSGSSPPDFWKAMPRAYPRARETGTATAFPTWQYLQNVQKGENVTQTKHALLMYDVYTSFFC